MPAKVQSSPSGRAAAVLEDPHEGALLVTGPPGSGKSHLLGELAATAPLPVVDVVLNPAEHDLPLAGLGAVLAAIDPRAAEFAGRFALRGDDPRDHAAAAADVLSLVRGLHLAPTAVLVDDLDRTDDVSCELLGFMAGRLGGTGLRLIATATRAGRKVGLAGFPRVRIPPLSTERALELVLSASGSDLHEGTARILVAHSAGNPATLLARARDLRSAHRAGRRSLHFPLPVRKAGRQIARHAIGRLDSDGVRIARTLSIAPLAHPAALTEAGVASPDQLDDLLQAGVLDEVDPFVRLRNPLVRATLHADLDARHRRNLHAVLADATRPHSAALAALHDAGAEPEGHHGEPLLRHAVALAGDGFVAEAVEFADAALRRRDEHPDPADGVALVQLLARRGEWALAERYRLILGELELPHRERSALAFVGLQTEAERTGRMPSASLTPALARFGDGDPAGAVRLLGTCALWQCLRGDLAAAAALLEMAGPLARRVDAEAVGLLEAVLELADAASGARAPARPRPAPPVPTSPPELIARARAATLREDYRLAARMYALVIDDPDGCPQWRDLAAVLLAANAIRAGDVEEAFTLVERLRQMRLGEHLVPVQVLLETWSDIARGRLELAEKRLRERPSGPGATEGIVGGAAHAMLGWIALTRGDAELAVRELSHADLLVGDVDPGILRHHPELIDALIAAGRPDAARAALDRFESAAHRFPSRWATLAVAGARAVVAEGERARQLFDRALGALTPDDPPLLRAQLLLRKGLRLRAAGLAGADAVLLQARAAFDASGASAWYRDDGAGPRPAGGILTELLSEPEQEVARLVLQGLQNKEIAARLYISLRTVELRLTHIYRKTGTRSRSQLVAALS